jgi:hypothetical protein
MRGTHEEDAFPPVISFNGVRGVFSRLLCPSWLRLFPLLPNPGIFCSANARAPFRCPLLAPPLRSCERRCAFSRLFNVRAASTWQKCGAFVRVDWIGFFCVAANSCFGRGNGVRLQVVLVLLLFAASARGDELRLPVRAPPRSPSRSSAPSGTARP